jgi:hypothetical protein
MKYRAFKECRSELSFEFSFAPFLLEGQPQVKFTFFLTLALAEDDQVVRPRQLSHQW